MIHDFLKLRKFLKKTSRFNKVYVSQDWTIEEREKQKQLVEKLKERIKTMPEKRHYILNGQIYSDQNSNKVVNSDAGSFSFLFDTIES